ncbi:unnamed protein product [Mytilus coruscus]|uniref:B box-type domain-containing protein n=1 Tax=Mytilus coruscus TaxID=42192 RepID=A0A6J8BBZ9_MYTCO|nr:unnamed protein product [Mytilus coruscus]
MAASGRLCDICETRDITVNATDWYPECGQRLCESCKSYHSAIKSKFENTVKILEKDVQYLIKKDLGKQTAISFSPIVELEIETVLPSLGSVNVITKESDIKLVNYRGKQAQILAIESPCVNKIQLKPVLENSQLPSGKDDKIIILDSCFLSHGRLAFSYKCMNKRLILLKDNGDNVNDIQLSFMPSSIVYITDNETVVGKCKSNEIKKYNKHDHFRLLIDPLL